MKLQKIKKLIKGKCCLCEETNYNTLDCHRINPGSKYADWGTLIVCSSCHRRIHAKEITILGKYNSTAGEVINYMENGIEKWTKA
jgi:hypothetical protein